MKRSEMLVYMQRFYGIRHVMVEGRYITVEQFMDELLAYMQEKGMIPPPRPDSSKDWMDLAEERFEVWEWEAE